MSHDDNRRHLQNKFDSRNRHANFGPILQRITINGFRGVSSIDLQIQSPIVALSGLNGTGKSTIAQLASAAYRTRPGGISQRYYVKDFFPLSVVDPRPFELDARVVFEYAQSPSGAQQVTVSRAKKEWSGYKRQPDRDSFYVGLTQFLPKIEKRDFSVYGGARLELGASTPVLDRTRLAMQTVLGLSYEAADITEVILSTRSANLAMVKRNAVRYSENHMGFGEGRMFYLINLLETAPERSLFVIEEPETSLHGDAQVRLAQYLVEVANRRRHQILMTTHSAAMLSQFARKSVVYLRRGPNGEVTATAGLSTYQVDSYLHENGRSAAAVCVEDRFAQALVSEVLRRADPDLLSGVRFMPVGDAGSLSGAVELLSGIGIRAVGISDSDQHDDGTNKVISLPGSLAPEKEVFECEAVQAYFAAEPYRLNVTEKLAGVLDHHDFAKSLAASLAVPEEAIVTEACRAYVEGMHAAYFDDVILLVRESLADRR